MPQPSTTDRLTGGEKRLAEVMNSSTAPTRSPDEKNAAARPQVDLVWDVDPDQPGHGAR